MTLLDSFDYLIFDSLYQIRFTIVCARPYKIVNGRGQAEINLILIAPVALDTVATNYDSFCR